MVAALEAIIPGADFINALDSSKFQSNNSIFNQIVPYK